MGLFDKKFCDVCGNKIGLLGNRKLEDGNLCKECAKGLSPWFSERRHSTLEEIKAQLQYREANKSQVAAFHATRTLGNNMKLMLDENARKFMVTNARDINEANPDVLDYSMARGCDLKIDEHRTEKKHTDSSGKSVSFNPPRYEYSYSFNVTISVDHPYFDTISFDIGGGYINTGEERMSDPNGGWTVNRSGLNIRNNMNINKYNEAVSLGNEIKQAVDYMRNSSSGMGMGMGIPNSSDPLAAAQAAAAHAEALRAAAMAGDVQNFGGMAAGAGFGGVAPGAAPGAAAGGSWTCTTCGQGGNTGNFCIACGDPKP